MRRKLIGAPITLLAAALVGLAGCSGATPLAGRTSGPGAASAPAGAPSGPTAPAASSSPVPGSSGGTTLPGLSTDCTAAVNAQVGVADIFGRAVDGTKLTAKDVSTVFDAIAADTPGGLAGELATLRDAAERSVGKSDVAVAEILQEKKITAARDALSEYVLKCSPPTS